ncbi:MAG: hypothetical protein ACD_78C00064G0004 [uncultured bacterium (gcode 4)]|uniref:Uncharacterized protein n=1 Tax=uncultured bacterium (gcode 4) TaxID=1234023 RepID=K1XJ79_9BACT|nr:MAG: hypothetical protein ACD_78C00064G0004 [uncultured bacterium (gcode 4)]
MAGYNTPDSAIQVIYVPYEIIPDSRRKLCSGCGIARHRYPSGRYDQVPRNEESGSDKSETGIEIFHRGRYKGIYVVCFNLKIIQIF